MKKYHFMSCLLFCVFLFISCASTMKFERNSILEVPKEFAEKDSPDLEFIGFKADANNLSTGNGESVRLSGNWMQETYFFPSDFDLWRTYKTDTLLKKLGNTLEKSNVAYDKSFSYFGIYSLQELELYKSEKRFVTFVEVNKNHLGGTVKDDFYWSGALLLGLGAGITSGASIWFIGDKNNYLGLQEPGLVLSFAGLFATVSGGVLLALPAKTTLNFNGEYEIFVYDTKDKKIVYKDVVAVSQEDTYEGSFFNANTNKYEVYNYYGTLATNAILQKYVEVERFLEHYEKD